MLKALGFSETITKKLEGGNSAYTNFALAYALYKIATPVRYTVTLGKILSIYFYYEIVQNRPQLFSEIGGELVAWRSVVRVHYKLRELLDFRIGNF